MREIKREDGTDGNNHFPNSAQDEYLDYKDMDEGSGYQEDYDDYPEDGDFAGEGGAEFSEEAEYLDGDEGLAEEEEYLDEDGEFLEEEYLDEDIELSGEEEYLDEDEGFSGEEYLDEDGGLSGEEYLDEDGEFTREEYLDEDIELSEEEEYLDEDIEFSEENEHPDKRGDKKENSFDRRQANAVKNGVSGSHETSPMKGRVSSRHETGPAKDRVFSSHEAKPMRGGVSKSREVSPTKDRVSSRHETGPAKDRIIPSHELSPTKDRVTPNHEPSPTKGRVSSNHETSPMRGGNPALSDADRTPREKRKFQKEIDYIDGPDIDELNEEMEREERRAEKSEERENALFDKLSRIGILAGAVLIVAAVAIIIGVSVKNKTKAQEVSEEGGLEFIWEDEDEDTEQGDLQGGADNAGAGNIDLESGETQPAQTDGNADGAGQDASDGNGSGDDSLGGINQEDGGNQENTAGEGAQDAAAVSSDPQENADTSGGKSTVVNDKTLNANSNENLEVTYGIDVSRYQGTIDWGAVAAAGIDFAMIRVGYRSMDTGQIFEDTNAKYNLQQATKNGIKVGVYFFSTAVNKNEAREEAVWTVDFIAQYAVTYPVAFNCEGYDSQGSRQKDLTKEERSQLARTYLDEIEARGYTPMFYASRNELIGNAKWETSSLEKSYKIWLAYYPDQLPSGDKKPNYIGSVSMWQYTANGRINGIAQPVDVNIAYFGYDKAEEARDDTKPEEAKADVEALMKFTPADELVTAKEETRLRDRPSQGEDSNVRFLLKHGEEARRIAISNSGWSKLEYKGETVYAVSSYLESLLGTPVTDDENASKQDGEASKPDGGNAGNTSGGQNGGNANNASGGQNNGSAGNTSGGQNGGNAGNGSGDPNGGGSNNGSGDAQQVGGGGITDQTDDGVKTTFADRNDKVTPKDEVNLRSIPSITNENVKVLAKVSHGTVLKRTGINEDLGWSRVEYEGKTLYCISSYLMPAE